MKNEPLSKLARAAKAAQQQAFAPYSEFPVGAALETASGKIYTGCNIENSSYSLTICAERVAVFKAVSEGETEFKKIAIATNAEAFCPPCGACRQVLSEFAPDLSVLLLNSRGETRETSIAELLPEAFDRHFLPGKKQEE
ncbi:MAG: cytidine deaminase [Calditrichaeota bacterium]|nr:MAG: cytidine deaminase [Calditrichota bacterium]